MTFNQAKIELEPEARAEWNADVNLRSEFDGSFENYLSYLASVVSGRARVLGGNVTQGAEDV